MKRIAKVFMVGWVAGITTLVAFVLFLGGETLTQAGLRLNAVEQGFKLAAHHWQFEATPSADVEVARWDAAPAPQAPPNRRSASPRPTKGNPR